jgi:hypothetical protein
VNSSKAKSDLEQKHLQAMKEFRTKNVQRISFTFIMEIVEG